MQQKVLVLDIGRHSAKVACALMRRSAAELDGYAIHEFAATEPEKKKEELLQFLRDFLTGPGRGARQAVIVLHNPRSYLVRRLVLPLMPDTEMRDAIRWELEADGVVTMENSCVDWQTIAQAQDAENTPRRAVMVACAERALVETYLSLFKQLSLPVSSVKVAPFVDICADARGNEEIYAVLDVRSSGTTFSIFRRGALQFVRMLPFGSDQLTASLCDVLVSGDGKIQLTREEAERIKRQYGIPAQPDELINGSIRAGQILAMMRADLERLVSEIKKSLTYYSSSMTQSPPQALYLTGGGAALNGLGPFLAEEVGMTVTLAQAGACVQVPDQELRTRLGQDALRMTGTLNALVDTHKRPNLLPARYLSEQMEAAGKGYARPLIGAALVGLFLAVFFTRVEYQDLAARLGIARQHLATLGMISDLNNRVAVRRRLFDLIKKDKVPSEWVMKELSSLIPQNAYLDEFSLKPEQGLLLLKGVVVPQGGERGADTIGAIMRALKESPFFDAAELLVSEKAALRDRDALRFEIRCRMNACGRQ